MNSTVRCLARPDIQVGGERFPRMETPPLAGLAGLARSQKRLGMMNRLGTVVMKFTSIVYKYLYSSMIVSTVRLSNCFYVCTRTHFYSYFVLI